MRLAWIAVAGLALAAAAPVMSQETSATAAAPTFQARDWINVDGRTSYESLKGEVVLLESWATT